MKLTGRISAVICFMLGLLGNLSGQVAISGTVTYAGNALEGVLVGIPSLGLSSVTGSDGTFTLHGVPAGEVGDS